MNALAKRTLGPWRIGDAGKTVFGPFTAEPCPVTVARMPEASPRCGADERKANALLIAAAPEMAMAALSAREMLGEMLRTAASNDQADAIDEVSSALTAALAKAGLLS